MAYSNDDLNGVYDFTDGRCYYCGKRISFINYGRVGERGAWEVDHFYPLASNGADQLYNWVPACVDCNTRKGSLLPWKFDPKRFDVGCRDPEDYL